MRWTATVWFCWMQPLFLWSTLTTTTCAQPLDCSMPDSFANEYDLRGDGSLLLRGFVNPQEQTVRVEMEYQGEAWLGMSFASSPAMVPNTAVIGVPSTDKVQKYNLADRNLPSVTPAAEARQTLLDATITQEDGVTTLSFTKPLVEDGEVAVAGREFTLILWAIGTSNQLIIHGARGSATVRWDECFVFDKVETMEPTPAPFATTPPTVAPSDAPSIPPILILPPATAMPNTIIPTTVSPTTVRANNAGAEKRFRLSSATITFVGVKELSPQEILDFEKVTEEWYEAYYATSNAESVQALDFTTAVSVRDQTTKRATDTTTTTIVYDQTLVYVALDNSLSAREYALRPFFDVSARSDYASRLKTIDAFVNVETPISTPKFSNESEEDPSDVPVQSTGLSKGALVGIVVAGSLAVVGVILVFLFLRKYKHRQTQQPENQTDDDHGRPNTSPRVPTAVAVPAPAQEANSPGLPSFKDQVRNAGHDAQQPIPLAHAKPAPPNTTRLPDFKDQARSVRPIDP